MEDTFKPKIVVPCCNWCSYAGADLAGISRYQIKPYFRVIRTMCSARVDPGWIMEAFRLGADGVLSKQVFALPVSQLNRITIQK